MISMKECIKRVVSLGLSMVLALQICMAAPMRALGAEEPAQTPVQQTEINASTQWAYLDDGSDPAGDKDAEGYDRTGWTKASFDATAWKTGTGSFGAKNGAVADLGGSCTPKTLLTQYKEDGTDIEAYFFRTTVYVEDADAVETISGSLLYDDAATVYLNGVRIAGFDDDSITENIQYGGSNASAPKTGAIEITDPDRLALVADGGNVVAVEIHQGRASSSDIYFDFSALTFSTEPAEEAAADQCSVALSVGADERQMNFTWYADDADAGKLLLAKESALTADGQMPGDAKVYEAEVRSTNRSGYYSNQLTVTDLEPETAYAYQLVNGATAGPVKTFTTGSADSTAFSFAFAGDPQIGASGSAASDTKNWGNTLRVIATDDAFRDVEFLLSAGDQVNTASDENQYNGYLEHAELSALPVATVIGNHDTSSAAYDQHFHVPNESGTLGQSTAGGDYYFVYKNALFLVLNSNNLSTAEHRQFMKDAIAATADQDVQWKIVSFHHSVYSVASHAVESDILQRRSAWVPVFEGLGIDVVLMGHDHVYVRTFMMDGLVPITDAEFYTDADGDGVPESATDPDGILYVTANSASGSKYYEIQSTQFPYAAVKNQEHTPNISRVDITDHSLTVTTYRTGDMSTVDTFTINRTAQAVDSTALDSLSLGDATLSPVFDSGTMNYQVQLSDTRYMELFAVPADRGAAVEVNGQKMDGFTMTLDTADLEQVTVVVTAPDGGGSRTYTIRLERTYLITPAGVTAGSTYNSTNQDPNNIINNKGMSGTDSLEDTHDNHGSGWTMWHTAKNPGENAWVKIDLGQTYKLDKMYVWNMNQSGNTTRSMKNARIEYSVDGENWTALSAPEGIVYLDGESPEGYPFQFARASGSANEPAGNLNDGSHTPVRFNGVEARYVRITAHPEIGVGNYGNPGSAGDLYIGLSEVRFTYVPAAPEEAGTGSISGAEQTYYIKEAGQESAITINVGTTGIYYLKAAVAANAPAEDAAYPNPAGVTADPIITELNLAKGEQTVTALTPDTNGLLGPGNTATLTLQLFKDQACTKPVSAVYTDGSWARTRHWEFYLSESMHTDVGYTAYQESLRQSYAGILSNALNLVEQSQNRDTDIQKFKYVVESAWTLGDGYMENRNADQIAQFAAQVQAGNMAVSASAFNCAMENLSVEAAARLTYYTNRYLVDQLGIEPDTVQRSFDNPAFSKSYVDVAVSAGILYGIHSMNPARSPYYTVRQHDLFYMQGNNPENQMLILNGEHYAKNYGFNQPYSEANVNAALDNIEMLIERFEGYTGRRAYPYDKYALQLVGNGGDNGNPNGNQNRIADGINAKLEAEGYIYPRITSAFPEAFFADVEAEYSKLIPVETGTEENWWNDGWGTTALDSGVNKLASMELPVAETASSLATALLGAEYPYNDLSEAMERILLYDEHTWGNASWAGGSNTASGIMQSAWKRSNAYGAKTLADKVLSASLQALAENAGTNGRAVYVYNQLNWVRSDVVTVDDLTDFPAHFAIMDGGTSIPYTVEDGVLTFIAPDIPAVGYKTFDVVAVDSDPSFTANVTAGDNYIENAFYKVTFRADGTIASILDKSNGNRELVDQDTSDGDAEKFNQYRFYEDRNSANNPPVVIDMHTPAESDCQLEITSDGISAAAKLNTSAFRSPTVVQTVTLYNDMPRIDIQNEVVKEAHDNYRDLEEAYYTFPFNAGDQYTIRYDLPVGNAKEGDQIYGTSHSWYTVSKWAGVQDGSYNMVLATPNTSLMEFGERRTGEGQFSLDYISEHPYLYSYVFNNQWQTNTPDDQPGYANFRYSISTNTNGDDMSANNRFGLEISTPLQAVVVDEAQEGKTAGTYIGISAENVQISTMKAAEANAEGMILRFAETDGRNSTAVTITLPYQAKITETDIVENDLADGVTANGTFFTFRIPTYGFKTFRIVKTGAAAGQVSGVSATIGQGGTQVTWNEVPGAAYYQIFRGTAPDFTPGSGNWVGSTTKLSLLDTQVVDGLSNDYYYSVRAVGAGAAGGYAAAVKAVSGTVTDTEAPDAPVASTITRSENQIDLAWTPVTDNLQVHHYEIYRDNTLIYTTPDSFLSSYQDKNLIRGTIHTYTVVAVDGAGNRTESSAVVAATFGEAAAQLSGLTLSIGSLKPQFAPDTYDYVVAAGEYLAELSPVTVTATAASDEAGIWINGVRAESGKVSDPIAVQTCGNTITVEVKTKTESRTYTVTFTDQTPILPVSSATAGSTYNTSRQNVMNLINNAGMSGTDALTDTHDNNGSGLTMWHTAKNPGTNAWVTFDLGQIYRLDQMYVWNMNQNSYTTRGMKNVKIEYGTDGEHWTELAAPEGISYQGGESPEGYPFQFAQAGGSDADPAGNLNDGSHTPVCFNGVEARYVRITAHPEIGVGSYGSPSNANDCYVGLSEVRFTGILPTGEPDVHEHDWAAAWTSDAFAHWHVCEADGCDVTDNSRKDGYGVHTAGQWIIDTEATATADGAKHKACTVCGYIMETAVIPATGSGSSEGGSSSGGVTVYTVTVARTGNGTVTADRMTAGMGTTVTVTVKPDEGYALDTLTVTDSNGRSVRITGQNGQYTFVMPASGVTVTAAFARIRQAAENPFTDVSGNAYYADAVIWAVKEGVTAGTGATTFAPDAVCTRAQAVTFLWRAAGSPAPGSGVMAFADVADDAYYHDAVLWAVEKGITLGTGETTFSPDAKCTRAQIVTFLWRAQKSPAAVTANCFADVAADAYYADAVRWAVENGITTGTSAVTFSPDADCTRAQIVTFLWRCLGK